MLDLAESARSPLATILRKSRLMEAATTIHPEVNARGGDVQVEWREWVGAEMARRTAWYFFLADVELCCVWGMTPTISLDELNLPMPSDDWSWRASTATKWAHLRPHRGAPAIYLRQLHDALSTTKGPQAVRAELDKLGASDRHRMILAYSLGSLGMSLWSMQNSCLFQTRHLVLDEYTQRCLDYAVVLGMSEGAPSAEVSVRFLLLRINIDISKLQYLSGRSGDRRDMVRTLESVQTQLSSDPKRMDAAAIHAGRVIRLCTTEVIDSIYDGFLVFYAATTLFVCARSWQQRIASGVLDVPASATTVLLDGAQLLTPEQVKGRRPTLTLIGDLMQPTAPAAILRQFGQRLATRPTRDAWPIERLLGTIIGEMASVFAG